VQIPLFLLGVYCVSFGENSSDYCSEIRFICNTEDKLIRTYFILIGIQFGFIFASLYNPFIRRIFTLVPFLQKCAEVSVIVGEHQKAVDKGWVGTSSLSLSAISYTIIAHYTPAARWGLRVILLLLY